MIYGNLDVEFHASLLGNEELLERVASRNAEMNGCGGKLGRTYLLSQVIQATSSVRRLRGNGCQRCLKRLMFSYFVYALEAAGEATMHGERFVMDPGFPSTGRR